MRIGGKFYERKCPVLKNNNGNGSYSCENLRSVLTPVITCNGADRFSILIVRMGLRTEYHSRTAQHWYNLGMYIRRVALQPFACRSCLSYGLVLYLFLSFLSISFSFQFFFSLSRCPPPATVNFFLSFSCSFSF